MKNMGKKQRFPVRAQQSEETVELRAKPGARRLEDYKYLETKEIESLFQVIKDKRDRAIFRLCYHRGLRAHEVGLLTLADFRDRDGVLFVHRGKGSVSPEHSLTNEELRAMRAYLREVRGSMPGVLFPSRQGQRGISRFRLDQLMKHYCELAGIPIDKAHMHALKHSCGTHLAEWGLAADAIQDWLDHRDSSSTDVYMHFSKKRRAEVAKSCAIGSSGEGTKRNLKHAKRKLQNSEELERIWAFFGPILSVITEIAGSAFWRTLERVFARANKTRNDTT